MSGPDRFYLYHGRPRLASPSRSSEIWDYTEDPRGLSGLMDAELPLKRREPRGLLRGVIHKGGTSPQQTVQILEKRRLSTHLAIAKNRIYQVADLGMMAEHAGGGGNKESIGVDIAQSDEPSTKAWHERVQGLDVEVVRNPLGPGPDPELSLDARTAQTMRDVIRDSWELFGIPMRVPLNPDGSFRYRRLSLAEVRAWRGWLGHFHLSDEKQDPSRGWWEAVWQPLLGMRAAQNGDTPQNGDTAQSFDFTGGVTDHFAEPTRDPGTPRPYSDGITPVSYEPPTEARGVAPGTQITERPSWPIYLGLFATAALGLGAGVIGYRRQKRKGRR